MRTILLATDERPQLPPLTDTVPGPLVPVANRPVIGRTLELLARAGCKHALVSLYNRGRSIAAYVSTGGRWGLSVSFLTQQEPLGSAGSLHLARHLLNETFLALPADAILDLDIEAALAFHRAHGGTATVVVQRRERQRGVVAQLDGTRLRAVEPVSNWGQARYITGAYIFEAGVLPFIPAHVATDCARELLPALIHTGHDLHAFELHGYWNPLETFHDYRQAQQTLLHNALDARSGEAFAQHETPRLRFPAFREQQIAPGIWVGRNTLIHPSAQLAAPVCIGDNCWIHQGVTLGPDAVIGAHVEIDQHAVIEDSTVLERAYVGPFARLSSVVAHASTLIDSQTSQAVPLEDTSLLGEATCGAPPSPVRRFVNLVGALLLLVLALPLLVPLGLLSLLTTGGHLIQHSPRAGSRPPTFRRPQQNGPHPFSMPRLATHRADGSVTSFGHWLLQSGLAYLPSLVAVIRGECELVGVKPLHPHEAAWIRESWQQQHYDRPAGLTGAWYFHAGTETTLDDVLMIDAYYITTYSWAGDILLLIRALITCVRRQMNPSAHAPNHVFPSDIRYTPRS